VIRGIRGKTKINEEAMNVLIFGAPAWLAKVY
jgi:hypothetical protein